LPASMVRAASTARRHVRRVVLIVFVPIATQGEFDGR
jgi:hypothetical protein